MTTYQCPALANYAQLWLTFHSAELHEEVIAHRDTCEICTALREATIERRRRTADLHNKILIQFPEQVTPVLANIMRRLYTIAPCRPGDLGWVGDGASSESGRGVSGIRTGSEAGAMVGEAEYSEEAK